jgi:hypothetical protein
MTELLDAARMYLTLGMQVIALTGKTPNVRIHRHGLKDAFLRAPQTPDERKVLTNAFTHPETTGVGILTTWPLVVVDIDGEEGAQNWKAFVGEDAYIPDRWVAKTGRGLHLYMGSIEPTGSMKLGTLLDLKGDGGYVAAPPSQHFDESGQPDYRYEWMLPPDEAPLMEAPDRLAARIRARNFDREGAKIGAQIRKRIRTEQFTDGKLWASWGFDKVISGMPSAEEGNRNNYLFWAAATLAEEGAESADFEDLEKAALGVGLTPTEIERTIRSARRSGNA